MTMDSRTNLHRARALKPTKQLDTQGENNRHHNKLLAGSTVSFNLPAAASMATTTKSERRRAIVTQLRAQLESSRARDNALAPIKAANFKALRARENLLYQPPILRKRVQALPEELIEMIKVFVFEPSTTRNAVNTWTGGQQHRAHLNLLRINKSTRKEYAQKYYGTGAFATIDAAPMRLWLLSLPSTHRALIQKVFCVTEHEGVDYMPYITPDGFAVPLNTCTEACVELASKWGLKEVARRAGHHHSFQLMTMDHLSSVMAEIIDLDADTVKTLYEKRLMTLAPLPASDSGEQCGGDRADYLEGCGLDGGLGRRWYEDEKEVVENDAHLGGHDLGGDLSRCWYEKPKTG